MGGAGTPFELNVAFNLDGPVTLLAQNGLKHCLGKQFIVFIFGSLGRHCLRMRMAPLNDRSSDLRRAVVAYGGIVGLQSKYQFNFFDRHLG
jgi:hypothetical protein